MADLLSNELQEIHAMPDAANKPVVVSANAGLIDGVQSALRSIAFLITAFIAIVGLLKVHDIAGIIAYIQANGGQVLSAASGLIAFGTAAYGVIKAHKRGSQLTTVVSDPRVPDAVGTTK